MNTLDFLLMLKDTNEYIKTIHPDLEMLMECFSPYMFDYNFSDFFPFKGETFLDELQKDWQNITKEQIIIFADILLKYKNLNDVDNPLFKLINSKIKNYIVQHPNDLDVKKYYPIIVRGIVFDMQQDLNNRIHIKFSEKNDINALADVDIGINNDHPLNFYQPKKYFDNSHYIYEIYSSVYHEEYHMLVNEMGLNPACFKVDILKLFITKLAKRTMDMRKYDSGFNREFTQDYFYDKKNREESSANLYGFKKAKEELLKVNPNFHVTYLSPTLKKDTYESGKVNTHKFFSFTQDDFFEAVLDKNFRDNFNDNVFHYVGIITKMYNPDGTRKDFHTLKEDFENAIETYPEEMDVYEFYYYLIYRLLRHMSNDEIDNLITNDEDEKLINACLEGNIKLLNDELNKIHSTKLYSLMSNVRKITSRKIVQKELKTISEIQEYLKSRSNGRGK